MRGSRLSRWASGALLAVACQPVRSVPSTSPGPKASTARAPLDAALEASASARSAPRAAPVTASAAPPSAPELPPGLKPGVPVPVAVPGGAPLRVIQGEPGKRQAIVYLPGLCGDITAIDSWAQAASRHGTLVAVPGDIRCHGSSRYRWSRNLARIQQRIDRALETVGKSRNGQLETKVLTLIGYSQGATRAQALAAKFPRRYPRVLLGGAPTQPSERKLAGAKAVAVVGGQREAKANMRAGVDALRDAGEPVRFLVLPGAGHGHFGPDADRVMGEALDFLFRTAPPEPGGS